MGDLRLVPGMVVQQAGASGAVRLKVLGASNCDGCGRSGVIAQVLDNAVVDSFHYWKGHVIVVDRTKLSHDPQAPMWSAVAGHQARRR